MLLTNFKVEENYAIFSDGKFLDLHNDFDFVGFDYDSQTNCVKLNWVRAKHTTENTHVFNVTLRCHSTRLFKVELPEDQYDDTSAKTLEFLGFLHPDDLDVMSGCLLQEEANDDYHLILRFESGCAIKIYGSEVNCELV